jgi:HEAT repeat protein
MNGLLGQPLVDDIVKAMLAGPARAIVQNWIVDRIALGETDEALLATELLSEYSEPRIVDTLITRLRDEYGEGRLALVRALGLTRSEVAVPALSQALVDSAPQIRSAGIEALSKLRSRDIAGMLEPMLKDSAASVRVAAIRGLAGLDSTLGASVGRRLMKDDSSDVRLAAVEAVGNKALLEDAEPIADLLEDSENSVRLAAIRVLSQIDTPLSRAKLRNALDDVTLGIRREALQGYARVANFDEIAQRLLTLDVNGHHPWLDVRKPIEQDWIVMAARRVQLTPSAVLARLEKMNGVLGDVLSLPSAPDEAASDTAS